MNRTKIKNYAPQARRDFIQAVTDRAALYGLTDGKFEPVVVKGDVAIIGGRAFPKAVADRRKRLEVRVEKVGFEQAMEAVAYTWFNRLVAIRYMELHGYLGHGYRVLSHPDSTKTTPEIVEHAEHAELPGLERQEVVELKLAGNKEAELFRKLLLAQCNALHSAMPFLFERIDDETELVLPDNLLHSDSIVRNLVNEIDEEDWQEVEIIGWLYEAYVSERYEAVIGSVVASEDIPAATQRFTPKWIVRYLVQNTLGRMWLATYPQSALRGQMKYFIEPAEQTPEVQEQLKAITPASLNPEEITFLDPACGSAHILVEAYDLFKLIYQERGYRAKDIPALILTNNLFGLEIDDRAAQLAAFALVMKARADSPRLFEAKVRPNVVALQETAGLDAADITGALNEAVATVELPPSGKLFEDKSDLFSKENVAVAGDLAQGDIATLIHLFENAKTFGTLIRIPPKLAETLLHIEERVRLVARYGEGFTRYYADTFLPVIEQAKLLARKYDCVVANPPFMGSKYYSSVLKKYITTQYKLAKENLYACFMERNRLFCTQNGFDAMINIPNWMFLSSFEELRKELFDSQTIDSFVHNGRGVFGSDFGSCAFVIRNVHLPEYRGSYKRLFDKQGSVASNDELERRFHTAKPHTPSNADFARIPGSPVAYWASETVRSVFERSVPLHSIAPAKHGMSTGNNNKFLRVWFEVGLPRIEFDAESQDGAANSGKRWFPYNKGGSFRKWYGNNEFVLDYENRGFRMKQGFTEGTNTGFRHDNPGCYFIPGISWTTTSSAFFGVRKSSHGFVFDVKGSSCFPPADKFNFVLGFMATRLVKHLLDMLNPSTENQAGNIAALPMLLAVVNNAESHSQVNAIVTECVELARNDWDSHETSWDFTTLLVLQHKSATLPQSQERADAECLARFTRMKELEEENNRLFIDAYGLQDELSPEVPDDQITLIRPNREEDIRRLLSYAVGCLMGRYSLDKPGLIYAHSGNEGFDPGQYETFPADPDGILPCTELDWGFEDDPVKRLEEFVSVVWPKEHLAENLQFIEDGLGQPIRKYLATGFYKDHLRWYKRRPIYWLFSSGKQRAFQCLVYLHRYHDGTLARMRTEYVIPLQGKITSEIQRLEHEKNNAKSASRRNQIQKEIDKLVKQQAELRGFDERLRHMADQRIKLDLDDGVKVNYGKFGDLLAEVQAVAGGKDEE